jgi:hypothetical protein
VDITKLDAKFTYDELQLFFGYDYVINDKIVLKSPTVRDVVEYGEMKFYGTVYALCATPTDFMSQLWEQGIDWVDFDEFEFFSMMCKGVPKDFSEKFLGFDISKLELCNDNRYEDSRLELVEAVTNEEGEVFYNLDGVIIDRMLYLKITDFFRKICGFKKNTSIPTNNYTKRLLLEEHKRKAAKEKKDDKSAILPIVITLLNTEEFKYNSSNILDISLYELTVSLQQIQTKKNALALLQGSYSGMIDTSKVSKDAFNWIYKPINE